MSETLSGANHAPSEKGATRQRAALTHVPLSDVALPPLDETAGPWPGAMESPGGVSLHVRSTPGSEDATAVYVHGLGGSSTNWTDLAGLLAPSAQGIAPDLPGFGFSEPADGFNFSLRAHADVVARLIEERGVGPVHLVGNSMGGAISLLLAAQRPELVRTLTLISPAVPDRRPDPRRLSDPRLALAYLPIVGKKARRELAALGPRERAAQVIKLCFAEPESFPSHRLTELAEEHGARIGLEWADAALSRTTMEIFRAWFTLGSGSLWSVPPKVRAPSLVVWGTHDKVISVRRAERTARLLPRGRLLVLPRTGHVAQMERPVTVARAMLGMWNNADSGSW
ncbi:pimeloyl-ACP methyl ester carboxylesterase [Saccharomonospora amisosensis]|uniref:Pimeloyl-ACP methyl ester carboxylesterase n=1 Tax=Saccharomonospora amisosensis TaxID=1128677 RepID=A0A7X5UUG5_9PSEU|nr:alpha/beta hydrolase [Saccharomonospora amisosensis]NIJ13933.1 pimeloyl-ACP methyl ester carboxylesterase [Saccharomonospora amisosensis]